MASSARAVTSRAAGRSKRPPPEILGWREWATLPELGISAIKVKLDTGARTSSLHAFDLTAFERNGTRMVRFEVHPHQRSAAGAVEVEAAVVDERWVRNSGGQTELRPVIETTLGIGDHEWPIELALTRRDQMGFRMLLGRQALKNRAIVDPGKSYRAGRRGSKSRQRATGTSDKETR